MSLQPFFLKSINTTVNAANFDQWAQSMGLNIGAATMNNGVYTLGALARLRPGAPQLRVIELVARDKASLADTMSRALRTNPGLQALLHDLGVKVEGRDRSDVLVDMVKQLKEEIAHEEKEQS